MPLPDTTTPWRSEPVTVAFGYGYVASKLGDVPPACYLSLSENWVCSPLNSPNLRPRFSFQKPDGILRCVSGLTLSCIKTHSFFCPASSLRNSGDPFTCHALTVVRNGAWPSNTKMSGISNEPWCFRPLGFTSWYTWLDIFSHISIPSVALSGALGPIHPRSQPFLKAAMTSGMG